VTLDTYRPRPPRRPWSWPLFKKRCVGCGVEIKTPAPNRGSGKVELLCPACKTRKAAAK